MAPAAISAITVDAAAKIRHRLRRCRFSASPRAEGTTVLSGGLHARGIAMVDAEAVGVRQTPALANAQAKSVHRANRSAGSFARATASTGSKAASLGRVFASAGGAAVRWRLMTTAGLLCGNSVDPVSRWEAWAASAY